MVQKGGEDRPQARNVHPPLSSLDVDGGPSSRAIATISQVLRKLTFFKVNAGLSPGTKSYGLILRTELLCVMGRVVRALGRLSMDRVKTGVAGLDTILNGGLLPARPYVVSGPTGGGKTILAVHFLLEGLRQQEPCLLVTLDEPPIEVKANMATFSWNLDRLKILDATPDIRAHKRQRSVIDVGTFLDVRDMEDVTEIRQSSQIRALEVTVHSVQKMIKQEFSHHLERTKQRYKRVVIDSMTALKMFAMQGQDSRILIQSFVRFLAELEATTLIVSERLNKKILETEFFLARGEIRLNKWIDGSVIRRAISIEKFRGSTFDDRMHPISIGDNGMVVYLDAPAQTRVSTPAPKPGESLLETRLIDEVSNVIESIMRQIEDAHRRQVPIRDIEVSLSRAMLAFQRLNYQKAMKLALACDSELKERLGKAPLPPPISTPPRPPPEIRLRPQPRSGPASRVSTRCSTAV